MDEYISGDEDLDLEGEDFIGAVARAVRRQRPGGGVARRAIAPQGLPAHRPVVAAQAGDVAGQLIKGYLGMGTTTFGAADVADRTLVVEPQRQFRPHRLIIGVTLTGTPAGVAFVRQITVGDMPQSPSLEQPAPLEMFRPDATEAYIEFRTVDSGVRLAITFGITAAPGMGNAVTLVAGFFGDFLR